MESISTAPSKLARVRIGKLDGEERNKRDRIESIDREITSMNAGLVNITARVGNLKSRNDAIIKRNRNLDQRDEELRICVLLPKMNVAG